MTPMQTHPAAFPGARLVARLPAFALAFVLSVLLALALAPSPALAQAKSAAGGSPRLSNLSIEIWSEYDRPGAALVILKGELAPEVALPAKIALRLPKSSGGPSAVAFFKEPGSGPLNLEHKAETTGDVINVRFELPERVFLVEFYDPVPTAQSARGYTYNWAGDLAADRITVIVQEPATATGLDMQPKHERTNTGNDGLNYLSAQLGPQPAGKALPITVRYSKADARTTTEIVKPKSSAPAAAAPSLPSGPAAPAPASGTPLPGSVIAMIVVALLSGITAVGLFLWQRRGGAPSHPPHGACTKCGAPRRAGDRFCGKCGVKLA
jgi:hypothetical protein